MTMKSTPDVKPKLEAQNQKKSIIFDWYVNYRPKYRKIRLSLSTLEIKPEN